MLFILGFTLSIVYAGMVVHDVLCIDAFEPGFCLFFLLGFTYINSVGYLFFLFLPIGVLSDYLLSLLIIVVIHVTRQKRKDTDSQGCFENNFKKDDSQFDFFAIIFIFIAVSFWSQTSLNPIIQRADEIIYKPWLDSFFHARLISQMADSNAFSDMQNMTLSGNSAGFYHYAYYFLAGLIKNVTGINAYTLYSNFLVPFGLFIASVSAFTLIKTLSDSFTALVSCVLLLTLPSASQMGLCNEWLNFHWLVQISPGLNYGIAVIALAWLFMFIGCDTGRKKLILASWILAGFSINFKAQIFVANAFLLFIYPVFFLMKASMKSRFFAFVLFVAIFAAAIVVSWRFESLPLIRFDGSAFDAYSSTVISMFENAKVQQLFSARLNTGMTQIDNTGNLIFRIFMFFITTFGVVGVLIFGLLKEKTIGWRLKIFPVLIIINYLVMSLSLAYNNRGNGAPEEFLHRPFVWAYFIVTIYVGVYLSIKARTYFSNFKSMKILVPLMCVFLISPFVLGRSVTLGPAWGKDYTNTKIDVGLYNVSMYLKNHSEKNDIVQYSRNDELSYITAISERQYFVNVNLFMQNPSEEHQRRLDLIKDCKMKFVRKNKVAETFSQNKIKWFVLNPEDTVRWDNETRNSYIFESHGYKLYQFY